jgi:hypothetical protein
MVEKGEDEMSRGTMQEVVWINMVWINMVWMGATTFLCVGGIGRRGHIIMRGHVRRARVGRYLSLLG